MIKGLDDGHDMWCSWGIIMLRLRSGFGNQGNQASNGSDSWIKSKCTNN